MGDKTVFLKDVTIAFLSTSALLLTLVLAFISPSLPKLAVTKYLVLFATVGFFFTGFMSAYTLVALGGVVGGDDRALGVRSLLLFQFFPFFLGLLFLLVAVVLELQL
ncbi:MAG: hypothetical protein ABSA50_06585 [Candidatus Bathyarchaeia archaeon]